MIPPLSGDGGPCVTSVDCSGGFVCGYPPTAGCSAQGACVAQVSGAPGGPACGCDGTPVQYVVPGYTSEPVASPGACDGGAVDAGADGSAPDAVAGDAGEDG
jgi:hypothetical protein